MKFATKPYDIIHLTIGMENFIYKQYGERLAILNTKNTKICG